MCKVLCLKVLNYLFTSKNDSTSTISDLKLHIKVMN